MKKIIAAATLPALFAIPAMAGSYEEPVMEEVVITPATAVDATRDWSGFYGGLSLGTGSGTVEADAGDTDFDIDSSYGLYTGYNWDSGNVVYGAELDYSRLSLSEDLGDDAEADVLRLKGRVGYDAGRFMPYATAGFASVSGEGESADGYVYGLGLEYAATDNISVRGEYLAHEFEDFGDADLSADTFNIGLGYKF